MNGEEVTGTLNLIKSVLIWILITAPVVSVFTYSTATANEYISDIGTQINSMSTLDLPTESSSAKVMNSQFAFNIAVQAYYNNYVIKVKGKTCDTVKDIQTELQDKTNVKVYQNENEVIIQ